MTGCSTSNVHRQREPAPRRAGQHPGHRRGRRVRGSSWASQQGYDPAAVTTFLQAADFYLVAQALAHGHTVVTHEVPAQSVKKIKIPNVCIGMGIKPMTPFEMLRVEKARFVLDRSDGLHTAGVQGTLL